MFSPVPDGIAAVIPTTLVSNFASSRSDLPKILVYDGALAGALDCCPV